MADEAVLNTSTPEAEAADREVWLHAHHTTEKEQESNQWARDRQADIEARRSLKNAIGLDYAVFEREIEGLSPEQRLALKDKSPDDIAAFLDERAEAARDLKKRREKDEEQAAEQADASFVETPGQRETRLAAKEAYEDAISRDPRIAELYELNDLRKDASDPRWDNRPAKEWLLVRNSEVGRGDTESLDGEILAETQLRQAALTEAMFHQSAYLNEARAFQPPPQPAPDRPIGQIVGNNGQPIPITQADINAQVQLRLDEQAHGQRVMEAQKRYPDWEQSARKAVAAGLDVSAPQAAFIQSLPNSEDVLYHLITHHDEFRALSRMPSHQATRALIDISHKAGRRSISEAPRKTTSAPKPPSPVNSGGSSRAFDASDDKISTRDWWHGRNAELKRRGKL